MKFDSKIQYVCAHLGELKIIFWNKKYEISVTFRI